MPQKKCFCGNNMEVVAVDIAQRLECPRCQAQDYERERFEIDSADLGSTSIVEFLYRLECTKLGKVPSAAQSDDGSTAIKAKQEADQHRESMADPKGVTVILPEGQKTSKLDDTPPAPNPNSAKLNSGSESHSWLDDSSLLSFGEEVTEAVSDHTKIGQGVIPESAMIGKYRIERVIGRGGMGIVYEAHDTDLERNVAIKVLNRDLCDNELFIERFRREARAAAKLSHPNITHVYSIGEEAKMYFFVMEYVRGQTVSAKLEAEAKLSPQKSLDLIRQTALGLEAANQVKIIHRDIKPSNLLLTKSGRIKITDFGLAKAIMGSAVELTSTGIVMGTPLYMSPEQGKGAAVDCRSDIYSLGATFFHLLNGHPPFQGDSPIAIILNHLNDPVVFPDSGDIPSPFQTVIRKMLAKKPEQRYQNYKELLEDLDNLTTGQEIVVDTDTKPEIVMFRLRQKKARSTNLFSVGKLTLARTNLRLGRREKALSLLNEIVDNNENDALTVEAALLLLSIYERSKNWINARRIAGIIARSTITNAANYAIWKLARFNEMQAIEENREALQNYERLLLSASLEHRPIIEQCIEQLKKQIEIGEKMMTKVQVLMVEH